MRRFAIAGCIQVLVAASVGCSLVESFDGYTDGGQQAFDVFAPDTGGRDGALDASRDAPFVPLKDTGVKNDSGGQSDSATATESGPMTCPDNTVFTPYPWAPPTPLHQGVCTSAETMQYLATFNNAVTSSGNAICDACIQTDVGSAEHGPVVTAVINGTLFAIEFNYGGCLASFDGSTGPGCCGNALNNGNDCAHQECDSCADSASKNTCVGIVSNGACAAFGLLSSCQSEANAGNVQVCFSQTGTLAGLQPMLDLWCGGAPDAGTPVDTGADDAKDD